MVLLIEGLLGWISGSLPIQQLPLCANILNKDHKLWHVSWFCYSVGQLVWLLCGSAGLAALWVSWFGCSVGQLVLLLSGSAGLAALWVSWFGCSVGQLVLLLSGSAGLAAL